MPSDRSSILRGSDSSVVWSQASARERDRSGISHSIAKKVGFSSFPLLFISCILYKLCFLNFVEQFSVFCLSELLKLYISFDTFVHLNLCLIGFHVNWESEMCGIAMKSNTGWSVWNLEDHWPSSWKGFDFFSLKSLYGVKTNRIPLLIMCQSNVLGRLRPILQGVLGLNIDVNQWWTVDFISHYDYLSLKITLHKCDGE